MIYILEDDGQIRAMEEYALKAAGFEVCGSENGDDFLKKCLQTPPRLAILDVMLPGIDGLEVLRRIRQQEATRNVPVIMVTAKTSELDVVTGLDEGADDYITKPFLPQELLLRLQAVLRRVYPDSPAGARLGELQIDWGKGTVCRSGAETALTAKEFALLKKLWDAQGNIVTIDALCSALWEGPLVGYENTLMVHIRRLREKIEPSPSHPQFLLTVRGLGYRLKREDTR